MTKQNGDGIPDFLKVKNRRPLTPAQRAALDATLAKHRAEARPVLAMGKAKPQVAAKRLRVEKGDKTIVILDKKNPYKKGTQKHEHYEILLRSRTVKGFDAQGGKRYVLRWSIKDKRVELK